MESLSVMSVQIFVLMKIEMCCFQNHRFLSREWEFYLFDLTPVQMTQLLLMIEIL